MRKCWTFLLSKEEEKKKEMEGKIKNPFHYRLLQLK